jgi:hypothetical protein
MMDWILFMHESDVGAIGQMDKIWHGWKWSSTQN